MNQYHYFAATSTYNCDAYGAGNYNENCAVAQTTDGGPTGLADTGAPMMASVIGGVMLLVVGVVLLVKTIRNKSKKK